MWYSSTRLVCMAAIKKNKRKRGRPFSALPRRLTIEDLNNLSLASRLMTDNRVCNRLHNDIFRYQFDYPTRTGCLTETDINNSDWEWKVLSFKEPFYKDYEERYKKL